MKEAVKILIPLDGTTVPESISLSISPLVHDRQCACTLFHVANPARKSEGAAAALDGLRKLLEDQGVRVDLRRVSGKPAEEIVREAAVGGYDLIAMSTHGRGGLELVELGSTAEAVIRSAPVPMLLSRSGSWSGGWDPLLVALDGTARSEEILPDVVRLARLQGARVHLLQVSLGLLMCDSYRGVAFDMTPELSTSYLDRVAADLRAQGVTVIPEHRSGQASVEIAHLARELGAGLICMATGGLPDELPGMERSVTAKVIRQAPCPVFVRRMSRPADAGAAPEKAAKSGRSAGSGP